MVRTCSYRPYCAWIDDAGTEEANPRPKPMNPPSATAVPRFKAGHGRDERVADFANEARLRVAGLIERHRRDVREGKNCDEVHAVGDRER
jgi:hypothetical protein